MLGWIVLVLVVILVVSLSTTIEGYDPTQRTDTSFADRYRRTNHTYATLDEMNEDVNRQKEVGRNVTDFTHTNGQEVASGSNSWEHIRRPMSTPSDDEKIGDHKDSYGYLPSNWDLPSSQSQKSTDYRPSAAPHLCELMHFFVLRETALTNTLATQFTAEQKLQLQTFMDALNKYVLYVQTKRPNDASNLARQVVAATNSSTLDVMIQFAQQTADSDTESKKLVENYGPVQVNPNMMAYIQAMLLVGDMTKTATSNC